MRALDTLHQKFQKYEDAFKAAKADSSDLMEEINQWMKSINIMLEENVVKSVQNKKHIEYSLVDAEKIDITLSRAEGLIERVMKEVECPQLMGLDK